MEAEPTIIRSRPSPVTAAETPSATRLKVTPVNQMYFEAIALNGLMNLQIANSVPSRISMSISRKMTSGISMNGWEITPHATSSAKTLTNIFVETFTLPA